MASSTCTELKAKEQELQSKYARKCVELAERQAELRATQVEVQELRKRLNGTEIKNTSLVPAQVRAGPGMAGSAVTDLQRILVWIAERIVIEDSVSFDACCAIILGDQRIHLQSIVQWRLDDDLRLSVPEEIASEVRDFFIAAKADSSLFSSAKAKIIVDSWQMTQCEDAKTRLTLLTHKESESNCIVADFPVPPPPSPKKAIASKMTLRSSNTPLAVKVGDHVEVNFDGQWYAGVVCRIDGTDSYVHCDVDPPEVITKSPVHMLRRPSGNSSATEESCKKERFSHARQAFR
jgi:hypothetical protein